MGQIDFALGFFAGEASFGLKVRQISTGKWYCRPYFSIGLDSKDDEILYQTHRLFGEVGSVDLRRDNSVIVWRIESSDDLESFVSKIENNGKCSLWESSEKYETYSTWKKIVKIYTENRETNDQQRVNMVSIAKNEMLNVGAGRQEVDYQKVIDYYADERNVYPEVDLN